MNIYELYLRSFYDSNGDGIGDFRGLAEKMDYLVDLGIDLVWFLPILKSQSFHGYSINDFFAVNPAYGSLEDLKAALQIGHQKGLKFILDLPLNHVGYNCEWFKRALKGEKPYVDWFLWADETTDINEKRDWDPSRIWFKANGKYYYALFGPGSPDLNYANHDLWDMAKKIVTFWLEAGFDGFRFDAAPHIFDYDPQIGHFFKDHEKNIGFWREIVAWAKTINPDAVMVSEVWDKKGVIDKYADIFEYLFNFPLAGTMKASIQMSSPKKFCLGLQRDMADYFLAGSATPFHSCNFLTNHDMSRLLSELKNPNQAKLAYAILFTLPGAPCIYYGEELGMKGPISNVNNTEDAQDPLHWYENGFGPGQTEWKAYRHNHPFTKVSVEAQHPDEQSMLNYVRSLTAFRKNNPWICAGRIKILQRNRRLVALSISDLFHEIVCYYNFSSKRVKVPGGTSRKISGFGGYSMDRSHLIIDPYATVVIHK